MATKRTTEENIRFIFEISIILKGLHALFEIIGGVFILIISQRFLERIVLYLTQEELVEDPKDFISNQFIHFSHTLSINTLHFAAYYLLIHGIIKAFLVWGLLKNKLWAYPTSIVVFTLFIVYQFYRYSITHSQWLLFLSVLDAIVIWLTWHEYTVRKSHHQLS